LSSRTRDSGPLFESAKLAAWCAGTWQPTAPDRIRGVANDTRCLQPDNLYIALRGEHFDGHDFVVEAFKKGAAGAVVCGGWAGSAGAGEGGHGALLCVEDPKQALQRMARAYRDEVAPLVIGVTGSAGKTTVKEMAAAVLSACEPTASTRGNWNNDVGLPLSLMSMAPTARVGVFEIGTNHPGELSGLCRVLAPAWGVITNIGVVHTAFFGSLEAIAREKAEVVAGLPDDGMAVLNKDDRFFPLLDSLSAARVVTVSTRGPADYACVSRTAECREATIREAATGEDCTVRLPLPGDHNVTNALFAVALGRARGVGWDRIRAGLASYTPLPMRWEEKDIGGVRVVNDGYNANPLSMRAAVQAFHEEVAGGRKWLVLADMLELGPIERQAHLELGQSLGGESWQGLVTVGALGALIADGAEGAGLASSRIFRCRDNAEAAVVLAKHIKPGDAVLLKGSRGMALEEIVTSMESIGARGDE